MMDSKAGKKKRIPKVKINIKPVKEKKKEQACNNNDYYLKEYEILSNAHFQISQQITSFFQFSLLIFSAPFALLAIPHFSSLLLSIVFILVGIVGTLVTFYLSKMRMEALLYARQINRIRNILYSKGTTRTNTVQIHRNKILLSQEKKPNYTDFCQFGFIIIALTAINSAYYSLGLYKFVVTTLKYNWVVGYKILFAVIVFIISFSLHVVLYIMLSIINENGTLYFKRSIGVDIDGVLNKHEKMFVSVYNEIFEGKREPITEEQITTLPVSASGIITKEDEREIFKQEKYWVEMERYDHCEQELKEEIHNKLGYKVFIYTSRDWLITKTKNNEDNEMYYDRDYIETLTKKWLNKKDKTNGIFYNELCFEEGNYDRPVNWFKRMFKTRFYYAQKKKLRFFVEDNVDNAIVLSKICEYVFLIEHNYNKAEENLPYNIIRVKKWEDITNWIKKLN